jgi:ubiquinone/menaquinone biosynthesis C-methylase UbiE
VTRLSFDAGAAAYDRFMGRWSRLYVPALLDAAGIRAGQRVLDAATGTGEAALMAADRVGPAGRVVGVDISLPMLKGAKARSDARQISLVAMDGTHLACSDHTFDAVTCQLGLMLIPDPARAAREFHRVLKPGGRFAACVWSARERVPLIGILAEVLTAHLPAMEEDLNRGFSLGRRERLTRLLEGAGFHDVLVTTEVRRIEFESFEDYWAPVESGGARLGQAYKGLPDWARRRVEEEVRRRMAAFDVGGRLVMHAEALIAAAVP